ncbi:MAG: hypothetical protein IK025_00445 [Bacteroidales bacterium]|nr:hypothetical protein [Bacteroidales bacterium]
MKINVAILFLMLIVFTATSFAQTDDRSRRNIKGNVESYTESKFKINYSPDGYTKGECLRSTTIYFDNDGNKTTPTNDFTYDYNTSTNHQATTFVYQPTGRITINDRKHTFTIDRTDAKFVCTYKESIHRPTSAKFYPCRGCRRQEGRTAIFKYDKQGNVVKITSYISQIEVNGDYISSSRNTTYNSTTKYELTFEYEYDPYGNWIVKKCFDQSGMMTEWKEREYKYTALSFEN